MSTIAVFMTAGTCAIVTGTRFSAPCRVAILEPSASRMTLSRPSTGVGSTVGRLSKWSLADLAARPAPSTTGATMAATSRPAAAASETMESSLRGRFSGRR